VARHSSSPGSDGVTFEAIEESGVNSFLEQIRRELITNTYQPTPVRKKEIRKDGGTKVRVLSIPSIRDRVVQGALNLVLEPIFEADFQPAFPRPQAVFCTGPPPREARAPNQFLGLIRRSESIPEPPAGYSRYERSLNILTRSDTPLPGAQQALTWREKVGKRSTYPL
jgi:hypothetical protein